MATVAVGDVFEDEGTVAGNGVAFAVLHGGFDGEDVHAVDLETGDVLAALVVFGQGSGAGGGGTHAVFVVWNVGQIEVDGVWEGDVGPLREGSRLTLASKQNG